MNDSKLEYEVSIYLKGDCLDPNTISNRLGVEPTRSHRKGDKWITSSGAVVTERTGLWVLSMSRAKDVSSALHGASSGLRLNQIKPLDSFGIDDAFIDIFISSDVDDNGGGEAVGGRAAGG